VVTTAPDLVAPPRTPTAAPKRGTRSWPLTALVFALLVIATTVIYGAIHRRLSIQANDVYARVNPLAVASHPGRDGVIFSLGPFLAVLVGSTVLAALRHRVAAFGIFALTAFTTVTQSAFGVLPADRGLYSRVGPNPLGPFWTNGYTRPAIGHLWRASAIDYSLALLPAVAIVAWILHRGDRTRIRLRTPTKPEASGLACSTFLFWLSLHTWELRETLRGSSTSSIGTDVIAFLPFFLFGLVLSRGSRWRLLAVVAVPILWSTTWVPRIVVGEFRDLELSEMRNAVPFVAAVIAGVLWSPIASIIDNERIRPWVLVITLNALNFADALFTRVALNSGQAVEVNPFAEWMGPGVKLIGVGVASALVARFRPRALIWLVVVFAAVIVWHLSGGLLDRS
jgi:hypothetical protein